MNKLSLVGPILISGYLATGSCSPSPTGGEFDMVVVDGLTAEFDGLRLSLVRYNPSWFPEDESPGPEPGHVLTTILVRVENVSSTPRSVTTREFSLRTLDDGLGLVPDGQIVSGMRSPRLERLSVGPGDEAERWLTFSAPMPSIPNELLWTPRDNLAFVFEIPWFEGGRIEETVIFGRVTTGVGTPQSEASLTITPVETVPMIPGVIGTIGECTGSPYEPLKARTDRAGRYRIAIDSMNADEFCIDVHAPSTQTRSAGNVRPGRVTSVAEAPMVRIDLVVE